MSFENKRGQTIDVDTLIVVWSNNCKEMRYGRVIKLYTDRFRYVMPDGSKKYCHNMEAVYVPDDQNEFEFEYTIEAIKS